jgi:hypothetical protein
MGSIEMLRGTGHLRCLPQGVLKGGGFPFNGFQ